MKFFTEFLLAYFLRIAFWFRYRVTIKGFDKLNPETLNKPGGILFLPNHPTVFVDPSMITIAVWPKYPIRAMIVEYMYYMPVINQVMSFLDALPVPNFSTSNNSVKKKKIEKVTRTVIEDLRNKKNFLIYPAGRTKQTGYEAIEGASAVHRIVQDVPEVNVVLVRIKGLWGSSFSRAHSGKAPMMLPTIFQGMKHVFKNLLFFTPRREVVIEFEPNPPNFPFQSSRMEFNKYLEEWYNRPDGLQKQQGDHPGDSLVLVPYSIWDKKLPEIVQEKIVDDSDLHLADISADVRKRVIDKIVELTERDPATIRLDMDLNVDLGMDSLDTSEIIAFLQDQFDVEKVKSTDLTSVGKVMAIAAKQVQCESAEDEEEDANISQWKQPQTHSIATLPEGETMPEVFLNNCARMGSAIACGDMKAGVLSYSQLKMRAIVLAEYIRHLPGEYIGIMLPSSLAASLTVLACQIAGKIPLMVNWTVGSRHLQAVADLSKVQVVLSSWTFIDRLQNVNLEGIEDYLVMLEDVRGKIGIGTKLKAALLSKLPTKSILKWFNIQNKTKDDKAVLLFTSGTESLPKGVPLSHGNILSNQRAMVESLHIYSDDVIFSVLPPFHSFGFTVSGTLGLLAGVRVAYSPDPTDGIRMAKEFEKWGVTIMCGAPTFIKTLLKAARPEQLASMRLCVSGAEKTPADLVQLLEKLQKSKCLIEGYGITECSPVLTFNGSGDLKKGVGKPVSGVEICIVDLNNHSLLETGQQGLILAHGPNVFSGYLNPGLSSPYLTLNSRPWYITGDLGYLDQEGNLIISGRLKRFIKIGAEMVSLASIEEALLQAALQKNWVEDHEEGPALAICAKETSGEKPQICLFAKSAIALDDVNKALKEAGFSNLVKVSSVVKLDEIPLMGSGKTNYRELDSKL